jgi:D-alanyl-D-alanine carboxypeptidase
MSEHWLVVRGRARRRLVLIASIAVRAVVASATAAVADPSPRRAHRPSADEALARAVREITTSPGGPVGIVAVVQRGDDLRTFTGGVAQLGTARPIALDDHMRLASVAKAFSGAAAVALVADGRLRLDDTVGRWRPDLPRVWSGITVRQLLGHTSGIADFSKEPAFQDAVRANLLSPPPPRDLLAFVAGKRLEFRPGTRYEYSNSDNIVVGQIVEAVTHRSYADALRSLVYRPADLDATSLPRDEVLPSPFVHGYQPDPPGPPEDVTELLAAGWAWASGGIVSTPRDANRFVRAYVSGRLTNPRTKAQQFRFRPGSSEPPGPGVNFAGLAVFRYVTRCGVVYGHTGNTAGYTQFVAATRNGRRSVVVSVNGQITPSSDAAAFARLRNVYELATCAALRG